MKSIYVFLFDGYSDWEIAYLAPEIVKSHKFKITTFSFDGKAIRSAGNLCVTPECSIDEVDLEKASMLILPGGILWNEDRLNYILPLVQSVRKKGITLAAICGATFFLARNGFLDNIKHTSNDLNFLKYIAPKYLGEHFYQFEKAYSDQSVITANGTAPIEFAKEVFKSISLYEDEGIEKWYQLFKNGIWSE